MPVLGCTAEEPAPVGDEDIRVIVRSSQGESPPSLVVDAAATLQSSLSTAELEYLVHLDWGELTGEQVAFDPVVRAAMLAVAAHADAYRASVAAGTGSGSMSLCADGDTSCMVFVAHAQLVLGAIAVLGAAWVCPPCAVAGIVIGLSLGDVSAADLPPPGDVADPVLFECVSGGMSGLECLAAEAPLPDGACPAGLEDCGEGFCVNLSAAYRDCGTCANRCASGLCVDGACAEAPSDGHCGDGIVDANERSDDGSGRCDCVAEAGPSSADGGGWACVRRGDCGDGVVDYCESNDAGGSCTCDEVAGCVLHGEQVDQCGLPAS